MEMEHLILYDGTCGVCDYAVQKLLKLDKKEKFAFAPLQGTTASSILEKVPPFPKDTDSIVLIENFRSDHAQAWIKGKAVFRIFWLEGGAWKAIGGLHYLPGWIYNWAYDLVARNRYRLAAQRCLLPTAAQKRRFLP